MDHQRDRRGNSGSTLGRRLARWARPPRILRPTRAGWAFFGITFTVGLAALNTGNNLLYLVLSLMLAFLVLSGVLSEASLRGIRVRRRLPGELYAGTLSTVVLEITNRQRRTSAFAVVVVDQFASPDGAVRDLGRTFVLRAGPGETVRRHYGLRPERRGFLEFQGFQVVTRFPFGLFSKYLRIQSTHSALVYPEVEYVPAPVDFGSPKDAGESVSAPSGVGADAIGLRDYARGDSARRIHWRASLRKRELMVREVESERDAEVEVRLRTQDTRAGEAFERAVGWAASEIVALLDAGTRVALRTDADWIAPDDGLRQRARLLSHLALIEPDPKSAEPVPAVA
jgi:uncharacterized protein (DUF58 family)